MLSQFNTPRGNSINGKAFKIHATSHTRKLQTKILRSKFYEGESSQFEIADFLDSDQDAENTILNQILNELQKITLNDKDLRQKYVALIRNHDKTQKVDDVSSQGSGLKIRKDPQGFSLKQDPEYMEFLTLVLHKLLSDSDKDTNANTLNQSQTCIRPKDTDLAELVDMIGDSKQTRQTKHTAPVLKELSEQNASFNTNQEDYKGF